MSNVFSLNKSTVVPFGTFAEMVKEDTNKFLLKYPKAKDSGIQRQENMILEQMLSEHSKSAKGKVKTLLLSRGETKKLGDKMRKSNRGIAAKDMPKVLKQVRAQGLRPLPVSENWLGEGFIGLGDFGHSACAKMNADGSIETFFPIRGLTSRLKTFHWTQGHSLNGVEVLVPSIVVVDENLEYLTPAGELLTSPMINSQLIDVVHKPAEGVPSQLLRRKFKSGRIVDQTGLKGITIPCHDLGTVNFMGNELNVNVIAGPNSLKGGLTQMKILAKQLQSWQEHKIGEELGEVLELEWSLPNGRKLTVKCGLSFVKLTELSDQFDSFSTHRMGTEVVRTLDLQGNKEVVEWMIRKTESGSDEYFRKMLGEIKPDLYSVNFPKYDKTKKWSLDSLVKDWDRLPFPTFSGQIEYELVPGKPETKVVRMVPSRQMVMNASHLLDSSEWIMPAWATAWTSCLVSLMSGHTPNWERLDKAIYRAMESKKGATRNSIRPKIPCLQGKQVGHAKIEEGQIGTIKARLHGDKAMVIRYPLLWNQVSKAEIIQAPDRVGPFHIDHNKAKGLVFRNFQDMSWEQSDADGDVCFAYILPPEIHRMITELKSSVAHGHYMEYAKGEAEASLKHRPVMTHDYESVYQELLLASQNKTLIGTATMDLWKLADLIHTQVSDDELIEILDIAAFYIQNVVVKGIKHELKGGSSEYNLPCYLLTVPEMAPYEGMIVEALEEALEDTMVRMGLKYAPREQMLNGQDSWVGKWAAKVWQFTPEKAILEELKDLLKDESEDEEFAMAAEA